MVKNEYSSKMRDVEEEREQMGETWLYTILYTNVEMMKLFSRLLPQTS